MLESTPLVGQAFVLASGIKVQQTYNVPMGDGEPAIEGNEVSITIGCTIAQ